MTRPQDIIRADVLGNLEALRSATTIAAQIVDPSGKLGVIKAGAIADILVVDGDPLRDIGVLTGQGERLEYVFQRGEVVSERGRLFLTVQNTARPRLTSCLTRRMRASRGQHLRLL